MATASNDNYFRPLTGVRAVAAYMVYLHHFNPFLPAVTGQVFFDCIREFHVGVTLFFVLSGFLIAYRYADMNAFNFRKYMVNRIARIYPMYFLLTTLTFIVYQIYLPGDNTRQVISYFLNITFLKGFFTNFKFSGIAQGWSLTVEETFYILAPVFFMLLNRSRYYLIAMPLLILFTGLLLTSLFSRIDFFGFFATSDFMFNYTFFGRCFEFFIGIALAFVYKNNLIHSGFKYFTYIGIAGIALSIYLITLFNEGYDFGIRHPMGKLVNTFILPLTGISVFYYGLLKEKTWVSQLLGSKLFVLLGKSSYIFYLIHMGIFSIALHKLTGNYSLIFIGINIISVVLFKFMEEPLNILIRKKFTVKHHT